MVKFSIIIPVYNTEKYLKECLNSVLEQTFKDFEIICINDCSSDNSLLILKNYAKLDERIRIINNEINQGAGNARNIAIKEARGEYIGFVDSDDYIDKDLLYFCDKKIKKDTELIIFGAKTLNEKNGHIKHGQYSSKKFQSTFIKNKLFSYHTVAYNKIYKKDFLIKNGIKFNNTKTGEDQIFFIKSALLSKNVEILKKDLYTYRKNRQNALTNTKIKNDLSPVENFYAVFNFLSGGSGSHRGGFEQKTARKIKSRYFLKAISWYGKSTGETKKLYLEKLIEIFKILKTDGEYWWNYFSITNKNDYLGLKLEYIKSMLLYKIRTLI